MVKYASITLPEDTLSGRSAASHVKGDFIYICQSKEDNVIGKKRQNSVS